MGPARRSLTSDYDREKLTNWKLRQLVSSEGRFPYRGGGLFFSRLISLPLSFYSEKRRGQLYTNRFNLYSVHLMFMCS